MPAIRYRSDAPKIFLMWVLSLILVTLVIIIICLSLYICRSKRKFSPSVLCNKDKIFLRQEFPHERISKYSSTMRMAKEDNPLAGKLKSPNDPAQVISRSSSRSGLHPDEAPVTTSHSIINVKPAPNNGDVVFNPLNPRSGSKRYQRRCEGEPKIYNLNSNSDLNRSLRHRKSALKGARNSPIGLQTIQKETLSKKSSVTSDDINECGLPIPPPPPIPPQLNQNQLTFLQNFSTGPLSKKSTGHFNIKYSNNPRSSIRRSIRKLHWTDVNNNNQNNLEEENTEPGHSLTTYAEETMKSSGDSVYF